MKSGVNLFIVSFIAVSIFFVQCKKDEDEEANKPKVTTSEVTNIAQQTASCGGNITDDGGASITKRGICMASFANPTLDSCMNSTSDGTGAGVFTSQITGLAPNFTYYVVAYAKNSEGISYGDSKQFTTIVK